MYEPALVPKASGKLPPIDDDRDQVCIDRFGSSGRISQS